MNSRTSPANPRSTARRSFLKQATLAGVASSVAAETAWPRNGADHEGNSRAREALALRQQLAQAEFGLAVPSHPVNGDDEAYPGRIGSFSKGLPHNNIGEVDPVAYQTLLTALNSGSHTSFEKITLGLGRKLTNPQAGLAFELEGADSHALAMRAAPAFASAEEAAEMAELYWMAFLRDVPFRQYSTDSTAARAAADLSSMSDFRGPKENHRVTPATLFRDLSPGCLTGPYISQFFWQVAPFGAEVLDRRMRTCVAGADYLTTTGEWLDVQRGATVFRTARYDDTRRYLRNSRDLAEWVHIDVLFQAYFTALLCLLSTGAPPDQGNPYVLSRTQSAFGTFGDPYIASLLCAVARPALKAVWYQKWFVHRRLRPEAFGGRVHYHSTGAASYPLHVDILNSRALTEVFRKQGTYLLPIAFPEGSPTHPAYGSGHATVAGACSTILKAFFDESWVLPNPVEASDDGLSLLPYQGSPLTVGGELNKLAANVAHGRNMAGVHWRTDATEGMRLGEEIALSYLREEHASFNEDFKGLSITRFDGTNITV
ncbi:MAG: hypothetical protein QOJ99_1532 [Bryobacterales bacterium]|jgi:hypothetical protein|nr:hypothetical protein [Bryobacterales bacterium]